MKGVFIRFALAFILGLSAYFLIKNHTAYVNPETLAKYQSFCKNSAETSAILDVTYTERKVKFLHFYTFNYTYQVGDANYKGSMTLMDLPKNLEQTIWYDTTNPSFSEDKDPCKEYEEIKNKPLDKTDGKSLMYGLGCALVAFFLFIGAVRRWGRIFFKVND